MPQRISDEELARYCAEADLCGHVGCRECRFALDLRDAREQLKTLKTYGEAKFVAETRLTELLKIAVEALELVADQNDAAYPKHIARTYLDRIKAIG